MMKATIMNTLPWPYCIMTIPEREGLIQQLHELVGECFLFSFGTAEIAIATSKFDYLKCRYGVSTKQVELYLYTLNV